MEESQFDVIIFGTGLVESITAAALSKAGYKVAHIDSNPYYGGDEASLSLDELVQWADNLSASSPQAPSSESPNPTISPQSRFHRVSRSTSVPPNPRQYSICLQPAVIPSVGPMIDSLVSSGVAKYSGFRLVDCVSVYESSPSPSSSPDSEKRRGRVKNVPGSKEDIFKSKSISLIEKRRLMRFLTFASGDFEGSKELSGNAASMPFVQFLKTAFSLNDEISSVIAYSLAYCMSSTEPTLPTLRRLQKYLRSSGRYGASPFLIGHYGGIGDIAQGFCRAAAVSGGVYVLGRKILDISRASSSSTLPSQKESSDEENKDEKQKLSFNYNVELEDFPDTLSCNLIISSTSYIPPNLKHEARQLSPPSQSQDKFNKPNVAAMARCIAILDQALSLRSPVSESVPQPQPQAQEPTTEDVDGDAAASAPATTNSQDTGVDTGILVFPPSSVEGGSKTHSATVMVNGEGSMSTPRGRWLVYITLPLTEEPEESISPETLLKPYLDALLSLTVDPAQPPIEPLFTTFYLEKSGSLLPTPSNVDASTGTGIEGSTYIVPAASPFSALPDLPDDAARLAEGTFMEAVKVLRKYRRLDGEEDGDEVTFWPPLQAEENDDDDEW